MKIHECTRAFEIFIPSANNARVVYSMAKGLCRPYSINDVKIAKLHMELKCAENAIGMTEGKETS